MTGLVVLIFVLAICVGSSLLAICVGNVVINKHEFPRLTPTLDPEQVLAELRTTISHGSWSWFTVLQRIAEGARIVTGANGAAESRRRTTDRAHTPMHPSPDPP